MLYDLPTTVSFGAETHEIRTDFRVILDIIAMLSDNELGNDDKADALLEMFYVDPEEVYNRKAAIKAAFSFIDYTGEPKKKKKSPKLTDWEQDFPYIISPVNRVLGYDARGVKYDLETNSGGLHWWTFLSAFMEIGGDCLYSQIVSIRQKQARGKQLDKAEREFARRNADLIKIKTNYTNAEEDLLKEWT